MINRPILAAKVPDIHALRYPLLCTPKIDGIRCLKLNGQVLTRSFKTIPNDHVRETLMTLPDGLDGELVVPDSTFHETQSALMAYDGAPTFHYLVFDRIDGAVETLPYMHRLTMLNNLLLNAPDWCKIIPQRMLSNPTELEIFEQECLAAGYEGVCMRSPESTYKEGRSTLREQKLLKLKRFEDSEAIIIDCVELQHNENIPQINELGLLKRSKEQAGLRPSGVLGALRCRDPRSGTEFNIGTGYTAAQRASLWESRTSLIGNLVTYKHQPYGALEAPRCPVFRGIRYDLSH